MNRRRLAVMLLTALLLSMWTALNCYAEWSEEWRYRDEDGRYLYNEWLEEKGKRYYLGPDGYALSGWGQIDGQSYFFDSSGAAVTGLTEIDDRIYFFEEDGRQYVGWKQTGDTQVEFTAEGVEKENLGNVFLQRYNSDGAWLSAGYLKDGSGRNIPMVAVVLALTGCGVLLYCRSSKASGGIWLIYAAVFMASVPLFLQYLVRGHDITFHMNRILGIEEALRQKMLPVRLNAYSLNGYGYADPIFYPPLFMYIPAILHMMGIPFVTAVNLFLLLIHGATAMIMYFCSRALFHSGKIGCMSSIIYTLCTYRMCNVYVRAAYGEMLAMIFLPLVIYGFYELFFGDERRWMFLSLGITGIVQSHILSTLLVAIVCAAAGMICIRRVLTKRRFAACVKMGVSTVLLNLWFLLPLVQYMATDIDTGSLKRVAADYALPVAKLLEVFSQGEGSAPLAYTDLSSAMAAALGLAIICGIILFFYIFVVRRQRCDRLAAVLFLMGLGFALISTELFPWRLLSEIKIFDAFASYLQFPWRFLSLASCFLSFAAAYAYSAFFENRGKGLGVIIVLVLSLISSQYLLNSQTRQKARIWTEADVVSVISQEEYLYPGTDRSNLDGSFTASEGLSLSEQRKNGLTAFFSYDGAGQGAYVDVPLNYYPGYQAADGSGNLLDIMRSTGNRLRVLLRDGRGTVTVSFREPVSWRVSEILSLLALVWIIFEMIRFCGGNYGEKRDLPRNEE